MRIHLMLVGLILFVGVGAGVAAERGRPNIVLIMADDLGYECLSCNGSEMYETPHLDALAASGMRFRNAHSQPICTPSRVQIMTGIYNNRNYIKFGLLDWEAVTFGQLLQEAGYRTCVAGKWQLKGGLEAPQHFGFERYCLWQLVRRPSRYPNPGLEIDGEIKDFKNGEFGPDLVTDYINRFIEEHREERFFVYYPMILPHWPFVPTPDSKDWDPTMWRDAEGEPGGYRDQKYWDGMVRYTDKMVGKVVRQLEELGLREETLVIFTGDNGTYQGIVSRFQGRTYRGGKGKTLDSGTHVPFIASWPGTIEAGQVRDELVDFTDVLPTLVEVGDASVPGDLALDGRSIAPLFHGREAAPRDSIYCWYERNGVRGEASQHVRNHRYKLYADGRFYDVQTDPLERDDLAAEGIPSELGSVHRSLQKALRKHTAVTEQADPVQQAKRNSQ